MEFNLLLGDTGGDAHASELQLTEIAAQGERGRLIGRANGTMPCTTRRDRKATRHYTGVEAEITAFASSTPPEGAKRWTLGLLEQAKQAWRGPVSSRSSGRRSKTGLADQALIPPSTMSIDPVVKLL